MCVCFFWGEGGVSRSEILFFTACCMFHYVSELFVECVYYLSRCGSCFVVNVISGDDVCWCGVLGTVVLVGVSLLVLSA